MAQGINASLAAGETVVVLMDSTGVTHPAEMQEDS
jgi:hypothetical protein